MANNENTKQGTQNQQNQPQKKGGMGAERNSGEKQQNKSETSRENN